MNHFTESVCSIHKTLKENSTWLGEAHGKQMTKL